LPTQTAVSATVTIQTKELLVTPTRIATVTNMPDPTITATQSVVPTETPRLIDVIQPTSTPIPSATAVSFDLPGWIMEPSANILLLGNKETHTLNIVNVDTGDQYEIYVDVDGLEPAWFWQEGRTLLSLKLPTFGQAAIDVMTGEVVKLSSVNRDVISPNGRYAAHTITRGESSGLVTIIDYETGTETELDNPFLHYQRLNEEFTERAYASYWSPDGAFLSVLYDKHYYSDNYDRNLVIYTPSGEIYRQYTNMDTSWTNPWASDLPYRILYTENQYVPPCILEVTENKRTCLESIDEWASSRQVRLFNYNWSPDGDRISFVYGNSELTGLCYYELATQNLVCPVSAKDLQLDEQLFARIQFWSPDGKYLVLFFDEFGFIDVVGAQKVGIINIDNQSFRILEGEYSWPLRDPWRPQIPIKANE